MNYFCIKQVDTSGTEYIAEFSSGTIADRHTVIYPDGKKFVWPVRLPARTSDSQSEKAGASPAQATNLERGAGEEPTAVWKTATP